MKEPIPQHLIDEVLARNDIRDISRATIRQNVAVGAALEKEVGEPFVHLEIGVPGIDACPIGIQAQKEALDRGVASVYPIISGLPQLKQNASEFVKAFIDIDVPPECIVPTVGSMQASFNLVLECSQLQKEKDTILYICPGFSAHGRQPDVLGIKNVIFDIYNYRAEKLRDKLEEFMSKGNISAILYSNPNNPAWICLTDEELRIIGECANKYDVVVLEDMAYLCMDFRKDMSRPFEPPFQPTVARYTDNYVITLSASKIFSYAGERIALAVISDKLYHREYASLRNRFGIGKFGDNYIYIVHEPNPMPDYVNTGSALMAKAADNITITTGDIVLCYPADAPDTLSLRSINAIVSAEDGTDMYFTRDSLHEDNSESIAKDKITAVCTGYHRECHAHDQNADDDLFHFVPLSSFQLICFLIH